MTGELIERMYSDFTTNVVPLLGQGVQITKDYAMEFLGRYWTYIIVDASFEVVMSLASICILLYATLFINKKITEGFWDEEIYLVCIFMLIPFAVAIIMFLESSKDLIKSIYVPEVIMYEQFKDINK